MPVRHGKTHLVAHYFPYYYLSLFPDRRILYASHSEESARVHGEAARDVIAEHGHLAGIGVRRTASKALDWQLVDRAGVPTGGGMKSVGRHSGVHGAGASLILLDDLYKDVMDAVSLATREATWRWLNGSIMTRLSPDSAIVSIGTPFHESDHFGLFAQAQEAGGDAWTRLRMPALAEPGDPLGRAEGEALWPDMFDRARLESVRRHMEAGGNHRDFMSMYMLNPVQGDGVSDWGPEYFEGILAPCVPAGESPVRVLALDPSKGRHDKSGDYSAWSDATLVDRVVYVASDIRRVPMERLEDVTVDYMTMNRYHGVIIESNGFQEMIATNVARKCDARGIRTPIYVHNNVVNKIVRIRAGVGPLLQSKRLKLVPSPGRSLLLGQLKNFPNDYFDGPDSVELAGQILLQLISKPAPGGGMVPVKVR